MSIATKSFADGDPGAYDTLILGIGNILWADEGFGIRTIEELHARYAFDDDVRIMDGGTRSPRFTSELTSLYARKAQATEAAMRDVSLQVMRHLESPNEDTFFIVT